MARAIEQRELRNQNARILAAVEDGESFVATRVGVPVAELRPLAGGRRQSVPRTEIAAVAAAGPAIDALAFRGDLDATIRQGLPGESFVSQLARTASQAPAHRYGAGSPVPPDPLGPRPFGVSTAH